MDSMIQDIEGIMDRMIRKASPRTIQNIHIRKQGLLNDQKQIQKYIESNTDDKYMVEVREQEEEY